jgi:hypothetical protein
MCSRKGSRCAPLIVASALAMWWSCSVGAQETGSAPADPAPFAFFRGTELSGSVDMYYAYNFNTPSTPCTTRGGVAVFNCLRNFDVVHNAFSLNLAQVALDKKARSDSRIGFHIDVAYGPTAAIVQGAEPLGGVVLQNVEQAYVSYLAPLGSGLTMEVGKFVSPAHYEAIETKGNWNYSRGLMFTLASPYYHMGVGAKYTANDKLAVSAYVVNGWNNAVDNNTGKTLLVSGTWKLVSSLSATETYIIGPEQTNNNRRLRQMSHTAVTYTPTKHLTLVEAYDWDYDREPRSGYWGEGVSTYARFQPSAWFALTPRAEHYFDKGGFVTGIRQRVKEVTLTAELKQTAGVLLMIEYRRDFSNMSYFTDDARPRATRHQDTATVGIVYAFSTKSAARAEK